MRCSHCSHAVVEMSARGPSVFTLQCCTHCSFRAWAIDGRPATIVEVTRAMSQWIGSRSAPREHRAA